MLKYGQNSNLAQGAMTLRCRVQNTLLKATIPIVKVLNQLMTNPNVIDNGKVVIKHLMDSVAVLGHINCELVQRRRDLIRPVLNDNYQQLCSERIEFTSWLSGDDLPKQVQDISATNQVSQQLSSPGPSFSQNWEDVTTDSYILNNVAGYKIDLQKRLVQHFAPRETTFSAKEEHFVDNEIAKLLDKQVIVPSQHEVDQLISTIFLTPQKDGLFTLILNLKKFNAFVYYQHFKMESLKHVVAMMKPGCFMACLDICDAYYSVPICIAHQKYLKFQFNGQLFQFTCMPNGLACAPRLFTKLLKPVYSSLRKQG